MKIYVSGPISGYDNYNEPLFRATQARIVALGHIAVIPHDIKAYNHSGECRRSYAPGEDGRHTAACHLRSDLITMLQCDVVLTLPGWEDSVGARTEVMTAMTCGMPVWWFDMIKILSAEDSTTDSPEEQ